MKSKILFILFVVLLTLSCSKSSTSPDEVILKSPENFHIEIISLTSIILVWQDMCEDEEGYFIEKTSVGGISTSFNLTENLEEYIDEDIIPGRNYSYKICSFYEEEFSNKIAKSINTFPIQIVDLEATFIDSVTLKLTWNEDYIFEHGFKIDKSIGWDNWENEVTILGENSVEWIDNDVNNEHHYFYRIYPYYDEFDGEKKGISLSYQYSFSTQYYVVLSSFNVYHDNPQNRILINWVTQAEIDNIGWNIIRSESANAIWNNEVIIVNDDPIAGAGTTNEPTGYDYIDNYPMEERMTYFFWLENYNSLGHKMLWGPIDFTVPTYEGSR